MFTRLLLAVILSVIGAQCASAGIIVDDASAPAIVVTDADAMLPQSDEGNEPVSVEQGATSGMSATVVSSISTSSSNALTCGGGINRVTPPLLWRVRVASSVLPSNPLLDDLLKPA